MLLLEGKDLRGEPLSARRKMLADVLEKAPENIRLSDELRGSKEDLLRVAQQFGLEGLVAKRRNSVYESGRRSGAWVKYKITKLREFVIGGYTLPEGGRKYFGSLLVGYHSPDGLVFAGRVGTGFSDKVLANLYAKFQKLKVPCCPFVNLPEKSKGRWGLGITPAVMKRKVERRLVMIGVRLPEEGSPVGTIFPSVFFGNLLQRKLLAQPSQEPL